MSSGFMWIDISQKLGHIHLHLLEDWDILSCIRKGRAVLWVKMKGIAAI